MALVQPRAPRRAVLKGLALGAAACALGDGNGAAAASGRGRRLPRASPEAVGIATPAIEAFVQAVEQKVGGLHSFMLLRHGKVAAEGWWSPYAPQHPHMLFSLSKSFASTAVGLAVAEGRLTVDAPVLSFFPDAAPAQVSENLAAMQVRHLLMMGTGHDKDATGGTTSATDGNWVKAFLALPVEHAPGAHFAYNSAATYMCSAIVQKLTGMTVLDYLQPRLFQPLGIEEPTWETCPRGISIGGWGLSVKTEDIARFGQLYLQKGIWNGRQLIPEKWVAEATRKQIANGTDRASDWAQGYGYQFWRSRHGAYRGDGAFGQDRIVMPPQDAVLAITSGLGGMQTVLDAVWETLLPAMQPAALPASDEASPKLTRLVVPHPEGRSTSPTARRISGRPCRFEANDDKIADATLTFKGSRCTLTFQDERGEQTISCGSRTWMKGAANLRAALRSRDADRVAASGAWTADDTYTIHLCFYETPFVQTWTWKFTGDAVTLNRKTNVGFGPTERPPLVGRLA